MEAHDSRKAQQLYDTDYGWQSVAMDSPQVNIERGTARSRRILKRIFHLSFVSILSFYFVRSVRKGLKIHENPTTEKTESGTHGLLDGTAPFNWTAVRYSHTLIFTLIRYLMSKYLLIVDSIGGVELAEMLRYV